MSKKPIVLMILDGYGLNDKVEGNAVREAKTPVMDKLLACCPNTQLSASGLDVGLPEGQMGNSEVGHTNIGAGRVVYQDLPKITNAVNDGSFFENSAYIKAMDDALANKGALHVLGLLSDGGVHSHIKHIFAILEMAKRRGLPRVYVHCFLDGRDVGPKTGAGYVKMLQDECEKLGNCKIATIQGRFWGMDRDKRWERLQKGYDAIVRGIGVPARGPVEAVEASYAKDVTDEFVEPVVCDKAGTIHTGDSVIFMNFRPDRAREMTWALTGNLPEGAEMSCEALELSYVCTAQYDAALTLPIAFPPEHLEGTIGEYVSSLGIKQYGIPDLRPHPADERGGGQGQARGADGRGRLRPVRVQLRQLRHGRPHGRYLCGHNRCRDRGQVPGRGRGVRQAQRHRARGDRGPRQRGQDGRARRQPQYRAYDEPRALHHRGHRRHEAQGGRTPGGHRADAARAHGPARAEGNDRRIPH